MSTAALDVQIGRRLVELRERAGLTRDACALRMATPPNELVSWELGEVRMPAAELYRFVQAVGCKPSDVYAFGDHEGQGDQIVGGQGADLGQGSLSESRLEWVSPAAGGDEEGQVIPFRRKKPGRDYG